MTGPGGGLGARFFALLLNAKSRLGNLEHLILTKARKYTESRLQQVKRCQTACCKGARCNRTF